jgi:GT2 family glycosyltransferase
MDKISVLIPTYKSVDALNLCLKSVIGGCSNLNNIQVIVGVDGTYDLNKHILDKFQDHVELLILEENVGLCRMTNLLVYNASHDLILILNDDNVVDEFWDLALLKNLPNNSVISPNQIEPTPSIFKQFHIDDYCGKNTDEFDLDKVNKILEIVKNFV